MFLCPWFLWFLFKDECVSFLVDLLSFKQMFICASAVEHFLNISSKTVWCDELSVELVLGFGMIAHYVEILRIQKNCPFSILSKYQNWMFTFTSCACIVMGVSLLIDIHVLCGGILLTPWRTGDSEFLKRVHCLSVWWRQSCIDCLLSMHILLLGANTRKNDHT